jgi:hypothetical protein
MNYGHQPYQHVADHSSLALVLKNHNQRFSPENVAGPLSGKLVPLRPVRIQSDDGSTVRTHWVGWMESIQPTVGRFGERLSALVNLLIGQYRLSKRQVSQPPGNAFGVSFPCLTLIFLQDSARLLFLQKFTDIA